MNIHKDGWSWSEIEFASWRRAVDQRLEEVYAITIVDAGVDDDFLRAHWEDEEPPFEFVLWYGNKYDLDPREEVWLLPDQIMPALAKSKWLKTIASD
jgi:hypothetical protein